MKILSALLAVSMILFSVSCASDSPEETKDTIVTETAKTETGTYETPAIKEKLYPAVPHPYTQADLDLIPIANASMSNDELRAIVLRVMRESNLAQWTPDASRKYLLNNGYMNFSRGRVYMGMPYNNRVAQSIYAFVDFIDPETGILTVRDDDQFASLIGTDCADAVFWAWARVSSTISFADTVDMTEKNGVLRVGTYTYPDSLTSFSSKTTQKICEENGKEVMYESYAALRTADGMVDFYGGAGHARLVAEDAHVSRRSDGSIDPKSSYIVYIDQTGEQTSCRIDGVTMCDLACHEDGNNKASFEQLYKEYYLPVTVAELAGSAAVQVPDAHLSSDKKDMTVDELRKTRLITNYRVAKITVRIVNTETRDEKYKWVTYGNTSSMFGMNMLNVIMKSSISKVDIGGKDEIIIDVVTGSGGSVEAYRGAAVL